MTGDTIVSIVLCLVIPVTVLICGLLLLLCKPKRNRIFGFRTALSLKDDEIWKYSNAMTGKCFTAIGMILLLISSIVTVMEMFSGTEFSNTIILILIAIQIVLILVTTVCVDKKVKHFDEKRRAG